MPPPTIDAGGGFFYPHTNIIGFEYCLFDRNFVFFFTPQGFLCILFIGVGVYALKIKSQMQDIL